MIKLISAFHSLSGGKKDSCLVNMLPRRTCIFSTSVDLLYIWAICKAFGYQRDFHDNQCGLKCLAYVEISTYMFTCKLQGQLL